jgi:hypothetical protein
LSRRRFALPHAGAGNYRTGNFSPTKTFLLGDSDGEAFQPVDGTVVFKLASGLLLHYASEEEA